jgi:Signal peptide peptidase
VTVPEVASGAASLAFCSWYYFSKHWLANNALGLAFSVQGIEHLSLGAVSTGAPLQIVSCWQCTWLTPDPPTGGGQADCSNSAHVGRAGWSIAKPVRVFQCAHDA